MNTGKKFSKQLKGAFNPFGKYLKSELGKSRSVLKRALKEAAKDMISDAIISLAMDFIQNLVVCYVVEPLIRKINKLCKQLGWNTRDFLAEAI